MLTYDRIKESAEAELVPENEERISVHKKSQLVKRFYETAFLDIWKQSLRKLPSPLSAARVN